MYLAAWYAYIFLPEMPKRVESACGSYQAVLVLCGLIIRIATLAAA